MKKILYLTWSYPNTLGSATYLCSHRVLECMATSERYEVHVLSCQFPGEKESEMKGAIHVHRFTPALWTRLRNKIRYTNKLGQLNRVCEVIQKMITIPTYPQTYPVTTHRYFRAASKLQKKENFEIVVSEHHDLASLQTGCMMMKNNEGMKHVAILWDPVKGATITTKLPKSFTDRRIDRAEDFVSRYTTLQISTLSMQPYHRTHGDIAADHRVYLDIPGILNPEKIVPTKYVELLCKNSINIVFSGLLSMAHRDALPIIRLLNQCEGAENFNLVFFSRGQRGAIENEARMFRGNVVYHDYIPLSELHTIYHHADYLLNISHVNSNMVPSKIFEYMSYGRPIISTYITDGDAAEKYINRYPEGLCIDLKKTDSENVQKLEDFLTKKHAPVPFETVRKMFTKNRPEAFLEVIDSI